jgi:alpha-beta hydrolase superfamily lysophospholipase
VHSISRPEVVEGFGIEQVREWPTEGPTRAVAVLVHGLAEHSGRYERTGSLLSDAGIAVRSFDLFGFGGSGGRRGDIVVWSTYHDQIEKHLAAARALEVPVVLLGHSMGGNLAAGYVISGRPAPDLLILSSPAFGGGAAWQRGFAAVAASIAPTLSIPSNLKGDQLSRDPAVGEAYFSDPLVWVKATPRFGKQFFAAMNEITTGAHEIDVPTLVLHGGADTIVPPQTTAFLADVPGFERRLYPPLRHELLNEPEGPELVQEIVDWVYARI